MEEFDQLGGLSPTIQIQYREVPHDARGVGGFHEVVHGFEGADLYLHRIRGGALWSDLDLAGGRRFGVEYFFGGITRFARQ